MIDKREEEEGGGGVAALVIGDEEMRMGSSKDVGSVWLFCNGRRFRRSGGATEALLEISARDLSLRDGRTSLPWLASENGLVGNAGVGFGSVGFGFAFRLVGVLEARTFRLL